MGTVKWAPEESDFVSNCIVESVVSTWIVSTRAASHHLFQHERQALSACPWFLPGLANIHAVCFDWNILPRALLRYYMEPSQCFPLNGMSWRGTGHLSTGNVSGRTIHVTNLLSTDLLQQVQASSRTRSISTDKD
jgi:hypothetical protein